LVFANVTRAGLAMIVLAESADRQLKGH
jgi:hypothetical protein